MSAIVGVFNLNSLPVTAEMLQPAMAATAHYGVEGGGTWISGEVGLGHHLLCVSPESLHEKQPFARNGFAITADARIYNRHQLFGRLSIPHSSRPTVTDCELILSA